MNSTAKISARTAAGITPRWWLAFAVLAFGAGLAALRPATAQEAPAAIELASADQLAELVGPIALYPDDLVAIVLPASTYPLQVVQAARFLEDREDDSTLTANGDWDDSVIALLNYPEVVKLLNDDLDWTYDLGTAVLNQRTDVLNAIQTFRDQAYAAGNLTSDDRQTVSRDDGAIAIKPANPQVIYVPYYEPERVVIHQPAPVYYYYPRPYPVYYYPYPAHYAFNTGFFWGVRSWYSIGWHSHHVHVYDWHYHNHPYYGRSYYDPWYSRNVYVNVNRYPNHVWEPRQRYGGRPAVRGNEGRVVTADTPPRRTGGGMSQAMRGNENRASSSGGQTYRSGSAAATQQARTQQPRQSSGAPQPRRGVLADPNRGNASGATAAAPQTDSNAYRGRAPTQPGTATPARTYRSGGGMSQALERQRSQVAEMYRGGAAPTQRARQEATGMPSESSRNAPAPAPATASPPRAAAPTSSSPRGGGMSQAMRGGSDGGSYRGNSGGSGAGAGPSSRSGGNSGGGRSHPAARGGEGRSVGR